MTLFNSLEALFDDSLYTSFSSFNEEKLYTNQLKIYFGIIIKLMLRSIQIRSF